MGKIGKPGTILSIYSGVIFTAIGLSFIVWGITAKCPGSNDEFLLILGIPILVYGLILIFGGFRQYKGIKKGKEYGGPLEGMK